MQTLEFLERDALFARKMYEMHLKYKFPMNVAVQWNRLDLIEF